MSTGSQKVDIFLKKFLTQQQFTVNFFDYLENLAREQFSKVYRINGIFSPDIKTTTLFSSSAINTFDIVTPLIGTDGPTGHIISLDPSLATQVPFQNTIAIDYFVGLRFQRLPQETEINVRTGKIKYTFLEESVGELAEPDSVVDDGDETLTIIVDSVTEISVSNAGRKVRIWLKQALTEVDAFEELTVIWNGSNNKIETTTALGQTLGNISTTASDYEVALIGPTVKRNTDLRLDANVLFLGKVKGVGLGSSPTVFDQSDANDLSNGLGGLSVLFNIEHDPATGIHSDINPDTINTKSAVAGPQLTTKVNATDEDVPDVPAGHSLFVSAGGTGIQGVKWRLQDSSGTTIAFIDAHGNAYFQNLAAVQSIFQSSLSVAGDTTLGDDINSDKVTFNSILQSLTNMIYLIDSNDDGTEHAHKFYNHDITGPNLLAQITESGDILSKAGTDYKRADGTVISTNASLNEVYDETAFRDLLKATPNNPNDKIINIAGSRLTAKDGSNYVLSIGGAISTYSGGTADFGTGTQTGGGPGFVVIDFSGQASQWAKYSVNLLEDNTILVIPGTLFGATKATAPEPALSKGAINTVVVAVQDDGAADVGTIENISEANFDRIPAAGDAGGAGGGGGGGGANWVGEGGTAPEDVIEFGENVWKFVKGDSQKLTLYVKVPQSYLTGEEISMFINQYSPSTSNTQLLKAKTFLIRKNNDAVNASVNFHDSTNTALTNTAANQSREATLDNTDGSGQINGLDVSAGDMLRVELTRGTDTDIADIRFIPSSTEVKLS